MANPIVKNGGAGYVPPDLLNDVSQIQDDKDYIDVVLTDLNLDTDYKMQFAWVYEDKTISNYSTVFEVTTSGVVVPEVSNILSQWTGSTMSIFFDRPEELVNNVMTNRAKSFIITLTALNGDGVSKTAKFTPNVDNLQKQQKYEINESRMDTWRKSNGVKYIPVGFTGKIQVVNDDGTSTGVSFTSATNTDTITGRAILDSEWSLTSVLDGYFVNIIPFTAATDIDYYSHTEVWESTTSGGFYSLVATGAGSIARKYVSDLSTKYIKIRHVAKAGTYSNYSNVKSIASANPSGYDATAPSNNSTLTGGTPSVDGDGLFDFNYKVPFTWTQNSDTSTLGYKIRFRISGSTGGYTFMSVPGRTTTSTFLYGMLANQSYEVGLSVYDEYDNVSSTWSTVTITTPAFTGAINGTKALTAGDMKLGYGIGGNNVNKGLYLSTNNYWYVSGNTVADNAAVIKIGSSVDNLHWNGTSLSVTGTINANAGNFTGSISVGSPTVSGQLRVINSYALDGITPNAAVEIGKFNSNVTVGSVTTTITGVSYTSSTATYSLSSTSRSPVVGQTVVISGLAPSGYNGTFTIQSIGGLPGAQTFTCANFTNAAVTNASGFVTLVGAVSSHGIYAYGTGGKYVLINAADASIRANNGIIGGWTIGESSISGGGTSLNSNGTIFLGQGIISGTSGSILAGNLTLGLGAITSDTSIFLASNDLRYDSSYATPGGYSYPSWVQGTNTGPGLSGPIDYFVGSRCTYNGDRYLCVIYHQSTGSTPNIPSTAKSGTAYLWVRESNSLFSIDSGASVHIGQAGTSFQSLGASRTSLSLRINTVSKEDAYLGSRGYYLAGLDGAEFRMSSINGTTQYRTVLAGPYGQLITGRGFFYGSSGTSSAINTEVGGELGDVYFSTT
jgi:hypothetical protein